LFIYLALPQLVPEAAKIPGIVLGIFALAFNYGAYLTEIFRAGIEAVPHGQREAALALGLGQRRIMVRIVLPQAIRIVTPAIGNEFIALLKDSSLVSILAVSDLLRRGREFASETFSYFETYTVVALIYLVITLFFSKLIGLLEERLGVDKRAS